MPTQRRLLAIVMIVIIVVSVGTVGWILMDIPARETSNHPLQNSTNTNSSSPTPTSTPTSTPTVTQSPAPILPIDVSSVILQQPNNPGGPMINITLQNTWTSPVVALEATLVLPTRNYTYTFSDVSTSNPLLPNQKTTQTATLIDASFSSNQEYQMRITGEQQDGIRFDYCINVTITTFNPSPTAKAVSAGLELTIKLKNPVRSRRTR